LSSSSAQIIIVISLYSVASRSAAGPRRAASSRIGHGWTRFVIGLLEYWRFRASSKKSFQTLFLASSTARPRVISFDIEGRVLRIGEAKYQRKQHKRGQAGRNLIGHASLTRKAPRRFTPRTNQADPALGLAHVQYPDPQPLPCSSDNYGILVHDPDSGRTPSIGHAGGEEIAAMVEATGLGA